MTKSKQNLAKKIEPKQVEAKQSESKYRALAAVDAALSKGALEPTLIDVTDSAAYTNYILIVSSKNTRQSQAICDMVEEQLKRGGVDPIGVEGDNESQWKLLDYGDVVIHVFHHPSRTFYDLEGIWSEAPRVELNVPAEQRVANDYY